jgi:predicted  nucleic acid-binding Zn-ribbon protein
MKEIKREQLAKDLETSQRRLNELVQQLNMLRQQEQLISQEILRLQGEISLLQRYLQEIGGTGEEEQ